MDWKKDQKEYYLPKNVPTYVKVPAFKFFTISGQGNPNNPEFGNYVGVLYSLAYGVKMSYKGNLAPKNYEAYTVYPLEGVWDVSEYAKSIKMDKLDKNELIFKLMIHQPDFVDDNFANQIIDLTKKKKPNALLDQVKFESIEEGDCVQMLHIGSYDDEPASFKLMEDFAKENNLRRKSKIHREIYLSDPRRSEPEKMKTVLRFLVEKL
jgi:hypothetical protein